jgi:hypothetical protein
MMYVQFWLASGHRNIAIVTYITVYAYYYIISTTLT